MGHRDKPGDDTFWMEVRCTTIKNIHRGTSLEAWLEEEGFLEEATIYAIKSVIAWQLGEEMKKKKITKKRMTEIMQISHAQLNHVLDPQSKTLNSKPSKAPRRLWGGSCGWS